MLSLSRDVVHVWYLLVDECTDRRVWSTCESVMTSEERARRDRFKFDSGKREFTLTRGLVRTVLSRYAPVRPHMWQFDIGKHGKPEVGGEKAPRWLRFNVSHSYGVVACAVCRDRDVGVDVEDTQRRSATADIAERFFAPEEVAALRAAPKSRQGQRFYLYWTLKESYIKARGLGLTLPLKKFAFRLGRGSSVRVSFASGFSDDPDAWQFYLWRPTDRHQGALALRTEGEPRPRLVVRKTLPSW